MTTGRSTQAKRTASPAKKTAAKATAAKKSAAKAPAAPPADNQPAAPRLTSQPVPAKQAGAVSRVPVQAVITTTTPDEGTGQAAQTEPAPAVHQEGPHNEADQKLWDLACSLVPGRKQGARGIVGKEELEGILNGAREAVFNVLRENFGLKGTRAEHARALAAVNAKIHELTEHNRAHVDRIAYLQAERTRLKTRGDQLANQLALREKLLPLAGSLTVAIKTPLVAMAIHADSATLDFRRIRAEYRFVESTLRIWRPSRGSQAHKEMMLFGIELAPLSREDFAAVEAKFRSEDPSAMFSEMLAGALLVVSASGAATRLSPTFPDVTRDDLRGLGGPNDTHCMPEERQRG